MYLNLKIHRTTALVLTGMVLLLIVALFIAPGVAAASCFTDTSGHWAESFICWMKTKGYSSGYPDGSYRPNSTISRAEVAVFMQKLISTGDVYINTGPAEWVASGAVANAYVKPYPHLAFLRASALGEHEFILSPSLPSSLYNTRMYVKGVKLCYLSEDLYAYITSIEVEQYSYGSAGWYSWNSVVDDSDIHGRGCKVIYFAEAKDMIASDQVTITVYVRFDSTEGVVHMGTTTVILAPSTLVAILGDEWVDPLARTASQESHSPLTIP